MIDGAQLADLAWPDGAPRPSAEFLNLSFEQEMLATTGTTGATPSDPRFVWNISGTPPPRAPATETCDGVACTAVAADERTRLRSQPLRLSQTHCGPNAAPIDGGAIAITCGDNPVGLTHEVIDVGGIEGHLVTCPNGTLGVLWMHGDDRLALVAPDPVTLGIDRAALIELAGRVSFRS